MSVGSNNLQDSIVYVALIATKADYKPDNMQ